MSNEKEYCKKLLLINELKCDKFYSDWIALIDSIESLERELHSLNASSLIEFTDCGIKICVNDEHSEKANWLIEVKAEGIENDTSVNDEHL